MSHDEMIAVIQAAKEGKELQCRDKGRVSWLDISEPTWDFFRKDYRVKPEPKVIYVNEYRYPCHRAHESANAAKVSADPECVRTAVKYIEAVEE